MTDRLCYLNNQHYVDDKRWLRLTVTIMTWWVIDILISDNGERVSTNTHPHTQKICGRSFFIFLPFLTLLFLLLSYPFHYQASHEILPQKYSHNEKKFHKLFFFCKVKVYLCKGNDRPYYLSKRENQTHAFIFLPRVFFAEWIKWHEK